ALGRLAEDAVRAAAVVTQLGQALLQREHVIAVYGGGHQVRQRPAAEVEARSPESPIRGRTHDSIGDQSTLLLKRANRVFNGMVENVAGRAVVGEQTLLDQQRSDLCDVRAAITAAEYSHALLALVSSFTQPPASPGAGIPGMVGPGDPIVPCELSVGTSRSTVSAGLPVCMQVRSAGCHRP